MDLVVDANALFAALIKEGVSFHIFFAEEFHLCTPEYTFTEMEEHKNEILQKTKRTPEEFERLLEILKKRITVVPLEELVPYVYEAEKICPDPDDVAYFALALKLNCAIWTNDKNLKEKQDKVKVYHTHDLIRLFENV